MSCLPLEFPENGNADGVILSRKYSWMKLTHLQGIRATLQQLHLST
jgi:hypothetical protein